MNVPPRTAFYIIPHGLPFTAAKMTPQPGDVGPSGLVQGCLKYLTNISPGVPGTWESGFLSSPLPSAPAPGRAGSPRVRGQQLNGVGPALSIWVVDTGRLKRWFFIIRQATLP